MPEGRVSTHLRHVCFVVTKLDAEMKFYTEVLGFRELSRGSSNGTVLSWINMKVPDGDDYVEFMLPSTFRTSYTGISTPSALAAVVS